MPCLVNKIGYSHLTSGINCQDSGCVTDKIKFVADGCGESTNSEVGAQLAAMYFKNGFFSSIHAFYNWLSITVMRGFSLDTIKNYFLFTTILLKETVDTFEVSYIGDGFIIGITSDNKVDYINLEEPGPPPFGAYNFIDPERLSYHKDGVSIKLRSFSKKQYKAMGVSTDGLRFIYALETRELFDEFSALLIRASEGNALCLKLFINKHQSTFQDDITIAI
jgi:hypothetical protein